MLSPLEQFTIRPILRIGGEWWDLSITNSTLYIAIAIAIIIGLISINMNNSRLLKNRYAYMIEVLYTQVEGIIKEMIPGIYTKYIPLITGLFLFILVNNIIGLIPYSFTTTAHIVMTMTMSIAIMVGVTLIGITKHKFSFIQLFIPQGLNEGLVKLLIPLIFSIEVVSYLIRVVSLSVRLTANLMSGHTLLKILANFGLKYTLFFPILLILPVSLLSAIYILEIGVAVIQAYVFTLLTATYIKDTELLH